MRTIFIKTAIHILLNITPSTI